MGFKTFCDNRDCKKEMEPTLDTKTNKTYCTICGKEIKCVTEFMKRQLVSFGQSKKARTEKIPYSMKCHECNKEDVPLLKDKKLFCKNCSCELVKIPLPFANLLREKLKAS